MTKPLTHRDLARFDALDAKLRGPNKLDDDERTEHARLAICIAREMMPIARVLHDDRWTQFVRSGGTWGTCADCPRRDGHAHPEECPNFARYDHRIKDVPRGEP